MAISPLPEPNRTDFLGTIRGAAESLWQNIKRNIPNPFGQPVITPLADQQPAVRKPPHFDIQWPSAQPSTAPSQVPSQQPSVRPAQSPPQQVPAATPASQYGRRPNFDWTGATKANANSVTAINQAAAKYGVPASLLFDIAASESSLSPTPPPNPESTAGGMFQFLDTSWKQVMRELGFPASTPKTDPVANAEAAAYTISKKRLSWWDASKDKWGQYYSPEELAPYYSR
jgi:soluble lytic murein transglycosylase-like protein